MNKNKNNSGFTLVEMLVTVFVFSIIMTIAGSIFVQALDLQRRAFDIQTLEENGRFALEMMAREIRFGEIQTPTTNCPSGPSSSLNVIHPINGDITYTLSDNKITKNVDGEIVDVTSNEELDVTRLGFCVTGALENDGEQPKVTIFMSLRTGEREPQVIDLQTTVTQRFLSD